MWRRSGKGPGPARRGGSLSLPDPRRVRPTPQVRTPASPAAGQGLAVLPGLWRDPETAKGKTVRLGAQNTIGRGRLPRKVSPLRAHRNPGAQGAPRGRLSVQSQARAGISAQPCAPRPSRGRSASPRRGSRARGRRVCLSVCTGDTPLSGSACKAPTFLSSSGIPSPSAEIPARPLPTLPRRKSGRAGDKETPASSTLGPSARPRHSPAPSFDPRDIARGHAGKGGKGGRVCSQTPARWRLPGLPARGHLTAAAPPPSAPQTVPVP